MTYEGRGRSLGPSNLALFKLLPPIDLFILSSSETNLKFKMALEVTHRYLQGESAMADFNGSYSCVRTLFLSGCSGSSTSRGRRAGRVGFCSSRSRVGREAAWTGCTGSRAAQPSAAWRWREVLAVSEPRHAGRGHGALDWRLPVFFGKEDLCCWDLIWKIPSIVLFLFTIMICLLFVHVVET